MRTSSNPILIMVLIIGWLMMPAVRAQSAPATPEPAATSQPSAQNAQTPPSPIDNAPDKVVVNVQDQRVTNQDIEDRFQLMLQSFGQQKLNEKQIQFYRTYTRQRLVLMLVRARLFDQEAARRTLQVSDQDMEQRIAEMVRQVMKANNWTMEEYTQSVTQTNGMTLKDKHELMKKDPSFKESILADKLIGQDNPGWDKVTQEEIRAYYDNNQSTEFVLKESVRASHILIKTGEGIDAEAARQKAMTILEEAKTGADFAELAKKYSECPTGPGGGDVGFFVKSDGGRRKPGEQLMLPAFTEAAFALKVGEISHLVQTSVGYHVIKVTDRIARRTQTFEEVKNKIETKLIQDSRKQCVDALYQKLKTKTQIQWHEGDPGAAPAEKAPEGSTPP